jgi:putative membrane protein insertion efficiency factor
VARGRFWGQSQQQHQQRRRSRDGCDGPDCGDCGDCGCDLFNLGLLQVFALAAPTRTPRGRPSAPARVGRLGIRAYQRWLSARLATRCPHVPTCSHYGLGVVERYGLAHGSRLILGRLNRCSSEVPPGTADPVP